MGNSTSTNAVNFLLCASVATDEADDYDGGELNRALDNWASTGNVEDAFLVEFTKVMQQGVKVKKVGSSILNQQMCRNTGDSAFFPKSLYFLFLTSSFPPTLQHIFVSTAKKAEKMTMSLLSDCTTVTFKSSSSKSRVTGAKNVDTSPFQVRDIESVSAGGWKQPGGKAMSAEKESRCFTLFLQGNREYHLELSTQRTRNIMADGFDLMIQKINTGAWPPSELQIERGEKNTI